MNKVPVTKQDIEKQENIEALLDMVDNNPNLIYSLPCEKLIKLIGLYKQSNAKLDIEINEMKKQLNTNSKKGDKYGKQ